MADGRAVVVMDADLQHPPALLAEMLRLWRGGAKIVSAVKQRNGRVGPSPWSLSGLFYRSFSRLAGTELAGQSDFKLLDREVVEAYLSLPERGTFFRALVPWLGFAEARIPFQVPERVAGRSKWSLWRLLLLARDAILSFSTVPLHLITMLGLLTLGFGLVMGVQTLWQKLAGEAVEGFATVILLLLACNGVLMLSLGVLGLYVAKIYEEVKRRPRYLVRERSEALSEVELAERR
jgi:glycosyltransferase involved in cell wall biosynthesis